MVPGEPIDQSDMDRPPRYQPDDRMIERLERDFVFHPVKGDQGERYQQIRDGCKHLAWLIVETTPPSREQSLALTALEQVSFNANAAIARYE